jgi:hypothetical protein
VAISILLRLKKYGASLKARYRKVNCIRYRYMKGCRIAGNALSNPCQWSFTTEVIPPQVLSVTPCDGASNVSVGEHIIIQFSEPVQQSTLSQGITVSDSYGNDVDGTLEYDPNTYVATFIPHHLEYVTQYTVSAGEAINDISGIPLQPSIPAPLPPAGGYQP